MKEYFRIGTIVKAHGIKGAVKVKPLTDEPEIFKNLKEIILRHRGVDKTCKITQVQYFKNLVILKLEHVNTMNDAELLRHADLLIDRANATPLKKDEYYVSDLYGVNVVTDEGEELGTIKDVIFTGNNDVYVVDNAGEEILIPAIKSCILEVNLEDNLMKVHLLKGLR